MSQTGTRAWWADVQHLRDAAERTDEARRRADRAELAARRASRDRRRVEAETSPAPRHRRVEPDMPPARHLERAMPPERDHDPDVPSPRRREVELPPPRRRDHVDAEAGAILIRRDHVVPEAADLLAHGAYGDGSPAPDARGGSGSPAPPARRTVEIRGRTVPAPAVPRTDRRRSPRRAVERVGPHPDRLALWALLMGLVLILVAVTTADAATLAVIAGL